MHCEEIREHLVEFVYDESTGTPASADIQEHLRTCSSCRGELEELKKTRRYLQLWKDEAPLRSVKIAGGDAVETRRFNWKYPRYAAIAAMAVMCFLALANTQISWNNYGFTFSTGFFKGKVSGRDYYTKAEVRDLMKRALDDSEFRMGETSYLMLQKMLDTVEQDRWMDLKLVRSHAVPNQNKN